MDNLTDESVIIKEVIKGNKDAFKILYDKHSKKIYALCLRMVSDVHYAEDLTQDIFVRAWEKIGTFKFKSMFYTWLYRLSLNVIMRKGYKIKNDNEKIINADYEDVYKNQKHLETENINEKIDYERALAKLPAQARKIFILHDINGYTHDEICEITGISAGTSKAHLFRAKKILIKELNI